MFIKGFNKETSWCFNFASMKFSKQQKEDYQQKYVPVK